MQFQVAWARGTASNLREWFGYPLPNSVAAALGIGTLAVVIGLMYCCAYVVVVIADRTGVRRLLNASVLADSHPAARVGRTILHVHHVWKTVVGAFILVVVAWAALHDPLVAAILGATTTVVVVVYLVGRKRRKSE